ncbi:MAG: hypothetical protein ACM3SY_15625 [Candidatus Omnitrophota bacterium]
MNKLFVLSGASGIGKSTILFQLVKEKLCSPAHKYSERLVRKGEDDIIHVSNIYDSKIACDIIYEKYNIKYGINTAEIKRKLQTDNQIIIVSDIVALKKLKEVFKGTSTVVYIFLSSICVEKLVVVYINRGALVISDENREDLILFASKITESIKSRDKINFHRLDKEFYSKVKEYFSNDDFLQFIKRYESWTKSREIYNANSALFDYTFEKNEEILEELRELIKKSKI